MNFHCVPEVVKKNGLFEVYTIFKKIWIVSYQ